MQDQLDAEQPASTACICTSDSLYVLLVHLKTGSAKTPPHMAFSSTYGPALHGAFRRHYVCVFQPASGWWSPQQRAQGLGRLKAGPLLPPVIAAARASGGESYKTHVAVQQRHGVSTDAAAQHHGGQQHNSHTHHAVHSASDDSLRVSSLLLCTFGVPLFMWTCIW